MVSKYYHTYAYLSLVPNTGNLDAEEGILQKMLAVMAVVNVEAVVNVATTVAMVGAMMDVVETVFFYHRSIDYIAHIAMMAVVEIHLVATVNISNSNDGIY